jgi:O-acetyl-ADP-ribose deacetylase (regulator of RNase III)
VDFFSSCQAETKIIELFGYNLDSESIMKEINYITGDATNPIGNGNKIICHICNDIGLWGKGFVLALSKNWSEPQQQFLNWYKGRSNNSFGLGETHFVKVEKSPDEIWIANMIGQHDVKSTPDGPPIRYQAVESCLEKVHGKALKLNASIHMPRIGCGLAGGNWGKIETIIERTLISHDIQVHVYDFK